MARVSKRQGAMYLLMASCLSYFGCLEPSGKRIASKATDQSPTQNTNSEDAVKLEKPAKLTLNIPEIDALAASAPAGASIESYAITILFDDESCSASPTEVYESGEYDGSAKVLNYELEGTCDYFLRIELGSGIIERKPPVPADGNTQPGSEGGETEPDAGSDVEPPGSETPVNLTFTDVEPIITENCATAGCHDNGGLGNYNNFADIKADIDNGQIRVRINGGGGGIMPLSGPLPAADKKLIEDWIDAGALPAVALNLAANVQNVFETEPGLENVVLLQKFARMPIKKKNITSYEPALTFSATDANLQ